MDFPDMWCPSHIGRGVRNSIAKAGRWGWKDRVFREKLALACSGSNSHNCAFTDRCTSVKQGFSLGRITRQTQSLRFDMELPRYLVIIVFWSAASEVFPWLLTLPLPDIIANVVLSFVE